MPVSKPKSPPKSGSKSRKVAPKKGPSKPAARTPQKKQPSAPPQRTPTFWETLSIDRRLDVIGVVLALVGLLTLLSLISAERSALTGGLIRFLGQIFGWGVYILPAGLIVIGVWLVLRNIERGPTFSIERVTGVILLYFWLLTIMHAIIAAPAVAEQAALDGAGGGYFGSLFERMLWLGLGSWGAIVAMIAWMLIGLALTLDVPIRELFKK
jgi:S-DNA-T family DNA segregation ATPase FtsK/SpoIIIE